MRSDSFASQVLGNIARTAPPFAERQHRQAENGTAPEAEPRSFFSWLRHALAYEPLHDDSPGRDAMRVRLDEEATRSRRTASRAPARHESKTDLVRSSEDHNLREDQAQEPVDQPTTTAAPQSHADRHQQPAEAEHQRVSATVQQMADVANLASATSAREVSSDEETRSRVRLLLDLLRTTDLNSLDPSDPLYVQYLGELIALRETLETLLGRSELVLSSQRRDPLSVLVDADLSDEQSPDEPPAPLPSPAPSDKTQESLEDMVLLTAAEVASMMRVSQMTVHRLVHNGHLPAIRVGRSFRVPEGAVHALLQKRGQAIASSPKPRDGQ